MSAWSYAETHGFYPDPLFTSTPVPSLVLVPNMPQWVGHGMRFAYYENRKIRWSNGPHT